jgi:hemin uptake protein HemP
LTLGGTTAVSEDQNRDQAAKDPEPTPDKVIDAGKLFGGEREVWIEHEGVRYRLRITRRNKLILQK